MDAKTLAQSLDEIHRFKRGEISLKTTEVIPPLIDVKRLRSKIGLSQSEFAQRFGFTTAAIRNWEQGVREPEGPARTLLALIDQSPDLIETEIRKLRSA
jgi:putative transcriptional regulator